MGRPKTFGAYRQHILAMDTADANPTGVEIRFASYGAAVHFRAMCYTARQMYQERTGDTFKWATLIMRLKAGDTLLKIEHQSNEVLDMKPLDGNWVDSPTLQVIDESHAARELAEDLMRREAFTPEPPQPRASRANAEERRGAKTLAEEGVEVDLTGWDKDKAPGSFEPGSDLGFG